MFLPDKDCENLLRLITSSTGSLRLIETTDKAAYFTEKKMREEILAIVTNKQCLDIKADICKPLSLPREEVISALTHLKQTQEATTPFHVYSSTDLVVTAEYIHETILSRVKQLLDKQGQVKLSSEIGSVFKIPAQFLVEHITADPELFPKSGGSPNKIEDDLLVSMAFEAKQDALLEEKVRGVDKPTPVDTLQSDFGCDQNKLLAVIKATKAGFCQGKLFIPSSYLALKRKELKSHLAGKLFLRRQDIEALHPPAKIASILQFLREQEVIISEDGFFTTPNFVLAKELLSSASEEVAKVLDPKAGSEILMLSDFEDAVPLPQGLVSNLQDLEPFLEAVARNLKMDNAKLIEQWNLDNGKHRAEVENSIADAFVLLPPGEPEHLTSKYYLMMLAGSFSKVMEAQAEENLKMGIKPKSQQILISTSQATASAAGGNKKKGGKPNKKGGKKAAVDEQATLEMSTTLDIQFSKEALAMMVEKQDKAFADIEDPKSLSLEPLSQALETLVNKLFAVIFEEAYAKSKSNAPKAKIASQDIEKELEKLVQKASLISAGLTDHVSKRLNRNFAGEEEKDSESKVEAFMTKVSEVHCASGGICDQILDLYYIVQASHNAVRLQDVKGLKGSEEEGLEIKGTADRKLVVPKFAKHLKEIFNDLEDFRKDNDFLSFVDCLKDNVKNLAAHVRQLDKKLKKNMEACLRQELLDRKDESLTSKLEYLVFSETCNLNLGFSGGSQPPTKKLAAKFESCYLELLLFSDWVSRESQLYKRLVELATLRKFCNTEAYADVKASVLREITGVEETKESLAESWVDLKEAPLAKVENVESFDEFYLRVLKPASDEE